MQNLPSLSVREITEEDISLIADYWTKSDDDYLISMGVDLDKIPPREVFSDMLQKQLLLPYSQKKAYALIWEVDQQAVGHCNINGISYGEKASMHLHFWHQENRRKGFGGELLKMSLPYFFRHFELKELFCEPYALNPAPNRILEKVGFEFIREYITIPGSINFEQAVKQWRMPGKKLQF